MTLTRFVVLACLLTTFAPQSRAQQDLRSTLFVEADRALAEARAANAELLAPATYARGENMSREKVPRNFTTYCRDSHCARAGDAGKLCNQSQTSRRRVRMLATHGC